jgi:diguanylate cyclase (GGDEF)-like protein/PAS domain S-box-containing protein
MARLGESVGLVDGAPSFRDLFEQAPCGHLCTTSDGVVLVVNDTLLRWTGHTRNEVLGRDVDELLTTGSRLLYQTRCLPLLRLKGELREVALEMRHADGRAMPILVNAVLRRDERPGAPQVWLSVFDSTERRDFERELLLARRSAEASEARTRVLQTASETFGEASSEPELVTALAELARSTLDAASAAVLLLADGGDALVPAPAGGYLLGERISLDCFRPEVEAYRLRTVITVADFAEAEHTFPLLTEPMATERVDALAVAPLTAQDSGVGVVVCLFRRRRTITVSERHLLEALARQAGQSLQRIRLQDQLQHAALHDPLTGLANREFVSTRLAQVLAAARRSQRTMALIFFDLDGFKQVNDTLGHVVGDAVLVQVADRLRRVLRTSDTIGRFGGDEFVVVCDDGAGADPVDLGELGHRIRDAVRAPMDGVPVEMSPTASVGVARHRPGLGPQKDPEHLMHAADAAMYHSKSRGKDVVTVVDV